MNTTQKPSDTQVPGGRPRGPAQSGRASKLPNLLMDVLSFSLDRAMTRRNTPPTRPAETQKPQEVYETHEFVYVRVPIPSRVDKDRVAIHASSNRVTIRWSPGDYKHEYQLPAFVLTDGTEASIKDNMLEVRLPKEPNPVVKRIYINKDKKT